MDLFRKYLLVGGLPDAVNAWIAEKNIQTVREIQNEIHEYLIEDETSIHLGSVYETAAASELIAHGHKLFYYDNRSKGEVDYLIDDYQTLSAVPIEVKSGKDYKIHSALNNFVSNDDDPVKKAVVLSNNREVSKAGKILYLPIYYIMFF